MAGSRNLSFLVLNAILPDVQLCRVECALLKLRKAVDFLYTLVNHIHWPIKNPLFCQSEYLFRALLFILSGTIWLPNQIVRDDAGFKNKLMGVMVYF
jgi:hypothetical protein